MKNASVVGEGEMEVAMPLVFVDCQWRITRHAEPDNGTTVLGLWQLWDSFNACFQTWIIPVTYWAGEDDDDDEPHGWYPQLGYEMSGGVLMGREEKADAPPTFWCDMIFEDGNRSFRVKAGPSAKSAKQIIESLAHRAAN
jgi:hypothetical protein